MAGRLIFVWLYRLFPSALSTITIRRPIGRSNGSARSSRDQSEADFIMNTARCSFRQGRVLLSYCGAISADAGVTLQWCVGRSSS